METTLAVACKSSRKEGISLWKIPVYAAERLYRRAYKYVPSAKGNGLRFEEKTGGNFPPVF